jgi:dTDP-4-amino-4,6-dideoxygalactose transaminase
MFFDIMQLFSPKYEVDECLEGIRKVLESGWTGCGPACREFEQEWSLFTGAKDSHYLSSATAALHIALRLCDLPPNSPVLTTPLTFVSTNAVILYEGHVPVFVDINENDFSLNADDFLEKMEKHRATAGMWVHYGGNVSPEFYKAYARKNASFKMIEDCAHAAGASYRNGEKVGTLEDTFACFSYQAVKNLPTFDSGMLCCASDTAMQRARKLSWLGIDKDTFARTNQSQNEVYKWRYDIPELGWKYNGNDIAATIGKVQLKYLKRDNAYRNEIHEWYTEALKNTSTVQMMTHQSESSHHLMVIRVKNRDEVIMALKKAGIAPGVHYLPNNEFVIATAKC